MFVTVATNWVVVHVRRSAGLGVTATVTAPPVEVVTLELVLLDDEDEDYDDDDELVLELPPVPPELSPHPARRASNPESTTDG